MAAASGLGADRALKAVTIDAARLLGIDAKYGSIEKGKIADLVLYDGDPFEHATHVATTLMSGQVGFSRVDYLKLPFERRILPLLGGGGGAGGRRIAGAGVSGAADGPAAGLRADGADDQRQKRSVHGAGGPIRLRRHSWWSF